MATRLTGLNARRARPRAVAGRPYTIRPYLALESRAAGCERVIGNLLVYVDGLGMLPQVIQS